MRPSAIVSEFQHYFSLHHNAFPYAIELIEKRDNYVSYTFENINEAISLSIVVSPYIEVMICFDDKEGNNLDHLVLLFEPCFSSTLLERALQVSVEYMKCHFLPTYFLVSRLTPSHSYAEIVSEEKLSMYDDFHTKMKGKLPLWGEIHHYEYYVNEQCFMRDTQGQLIEEETQKSDSSCAFMVVR